MSDDDLFQALGALQSPHAFDHHRVLVLNANGLPLGYPLHGKSTLAAADAVDKMLRDEVVVLANSTVYARSEKLDLIVPSVVMQKQYACHQNLDGIAAPNRQNLYVRDRALCGYGGHPLVLNTTAHRNVMATIDHVIPRAHGGPDCWENWVLASARLNSRKRDRRDNKGFWKLRIRPWTPTNADLLYLWYQEACKRDTIEPLWREFVNLRPSARVEEALAA